ncbi:YesL family protein [Neobacillus bataviensis]|uniref:YesL family protein n=1 Tax=Neobacillus bataviensis TaxID=220685 RepID=UPI001CC13808|nr:DUF624 domain-containing protein [Neobacillus bataviensis]
MGKRLIVLIMNWIWRLSWINLLWLVFSIPLITIIPSTFAMYSVFIKLVKGDDETDILPEFLHAFKKYFKKSYSLGIALVVLGTFFYADLMILKEQTESILLILRYAILIMTILFIPIACYSIPVFIEYEVSWLKALPLAFILAMKKPVNFLLVCCGIAGSLFLLLFFTGIGVLLFGSLFALFTTRGALSGMPKSSNEIV